MVSYCYTIEYNQLRNLFLIKSVKAILMILSKILNPLKYIKVGQGHTS